MGRKQKNVFMISFIKSFLLIGLLAGAYNIKDLPAKKVTCKELGIYFILPGGFTSLDSLQMEALSKRGEKAVQETFDKETMKGWQPGCFNLQDSLKRIVHLSVISEKEAIAEDGTIDNFIDHTYKDGNDFIIQRFKSKMNIEINEAKTAQQTEIKIAGLRVRKNAFTLFNDGKLLFFSRYYFFQKNGKLYFLSFLGSPKADDNEGIVKAIESGKAI